MPEVSKLMVREEAQVQMRDSELFRQTIVIRGLMAFRTGQ